MHERSSVNQGKLGAELLLNAETVALAYDNQGNISLEVLRSVLLEGDTGADPELSGEPISRYR